MNLQICWSKSMGIAVKFVPHLLGLPHMILINARIWHVCASGNFFSLNGNTDCNVGYRRVLTTKFASGYCVIGANMCKANKSLHM